jgi:uncharacterized domain HDIG
MCKIEKLMKHKMYTDAMSQIAAYETDRKFCKHTMEHAIDVARIAYILNLENNLLLPKDIIYATALLHDIGRSLQYAEGRDHNEASVEMAAAILEDIGFSKEEKNLILKAIHDHNDKSMMQTPLDLNSMIRRADKLSRACFQCLSYEECYWDRSLKNDTLTY